MIFKDYVLISALPGLISGQIGIHYCSINLKFYYQDLFLVGLFLMGVWAILEIISTVKKMENKNV